MTQHSIRCLCVLLHCYVRVFPGNIAQWLQRQEFKSKDPGFDILAGQGEGEFFYPSESTLVQTCLPFVCMASTHICVPVKIL